jgi:hypothetical protein
MLFTHMQYTNCCLCNASWRWASNARNLYRPLVHNKLNTESASRWFYYTYEYTLRCTVNTTLTTKFIGCLKHAVIYKKLRMKRCSFKYRNNSTSTKIDQIFTPRCTWLCNTQFLSLVIVAGVECVEPVTIRPGRWTQIFQCFGKHYNYIIHPESVFWNGEEISTPLRVTIPKAD